MAIESGWHGALLPIAGHANNSVPVSVAGSLADVSLAASTILARLAAGDVVAATTAQIKTLLALAISDTSGLQAALDDRVPTILAPATGLYLTRGGTPLTLLLVNGTLVLTPYWLPGDVDQIAINVTGAATAASGATVRFVVYADTGSYAPDVASAPLVDAVAAQTVDTTGDKTATVTLTGARWVWAGCVGQGAPATHATVRSIGAVTEAIMLPIVPGGSTAPSHAYTGLTGAIPTPIGVAAVATAAAVARIGMRMA